MDKYKYFTLIFGCVFILSLCFFFPVCFDNNDDQIIFFISSGLMSGKQSSNVVLSHLLIGKALYSLFQHWKGYNWYTLYLQIAQSLSFLTICLVLTKRNSNATFFSILWMLFILLGFAALCIVKLQFTVVALFCSIAALCCFQSELSKTPRISWSILLIIISILIRKECAYFIVFFSIPILISNKIEKKQSI